jgi:hypothetical protein
MRRGTIAPFSVLANLLLHMNAIFHLQMHPFSSRTRFKARGQRAGAILGWVVLCFWGIALFSSVGAWELPSCLGNAKEGWADGAANWTWDKGNPYPLDGGGEWTLAGQVQADAPVTAEYKLLTKAVLYNYISGWASEGSGTYENALFKFFGEGADGRKLCVTPNPALGFPQISPAAAILFKVPTNGRYQVTIGGKIIVQSKTAGFARVEISTLAEGRSSGTMLKRVDLNSAGGTGGNLSDQLSYSGTIPMTAGSELVTRLQTVSPGPGSAGTSVLVIGQYSIVPADKK